jgi:hypothetical protein
MKKIKTVRIDDTAENADWLHNKKGKKNGNKQTPNRSEKAVGKTKGH